MFDGANIPHQMTGMMMIAILLLDMFILDETYPSMLLVYKAHQLRYETGNWALHAKHEEWNVTRISQDTKPRRRPGGADSRTIATTRTNRRR